VLYCVLTANRNHTRGTTAPRPRRDADVARADQLKNRIHATLITFGHPCPVSDLFGLAGRELLDRLEIPDPWRRNLDVSLGLIDDLELQIATLTVQLKRMGADHRYIPLLVSAPGFGWINAFTVASEIGDIERFASPAKLCGYTGPCPRVIQSGNTDRRGPISKHGPRYLRWGLFEAAMNACKHPLFGNAPPERASHSAQSPRRWGDPDMSAAHQHHNARGP
jgi:transposase